MNFITAAQIATQFEKDFSKLYKLIKIQDKRYKGYGDDWFTCTYVNKITCEETEVRFPQNALEVCRIPPHERIHGVLSHYAHEDIVINGCNTCWDTREEYKLIEENIKGLVNKYTENLHRIQRQFDSSPQTEGESNTTE